MTSAGNRLPPKNVCGLPANVGLVVAVLELAGSQSGGHRLGVNGLAVDRDNAILYAPPMRRRHPPPETRLCGKRDLTICYA